MHFIFIFILCATKWAKSRVCGALREEKKRPENMRMNLKIMNLFGNLWHGLFILSLFFFLLYFIGFDQCNEPNYCE